MAIDKPAFGTPEFNAMYRKKGVSHKPSSSVVAANGVKTVHLKNGKVLQFGLKSKNPFAKLKTWQLALAAAGGALVLQHFLVPKGTSIVSKILGGSPSAAERAGYYVGAVNRGGYGGNSGMPFGPGPWPTQHAAAPIENGQAPVRPTTLPTAPVDEMAGWGHMEMPTPFGRGGPPYGMGYGGGGGHGGWPYGWE